MPKPTTPIVLTFQREKETKNSVRFQEVDRPGQAQVVGTLYVKKHVSAPVKSFTVTLLAAA